MKTKFIKTIIAAAFLTTFKCSLLGQGNNNIDIRFLTARFTDTTTGKDLVAVFLVSTKDAMSFPPEVTLPPKCTIFENGREQVVILTPSMLSVSVDGENMPQKNAAVYNLVKDQLDLKALDHSLVITYTIKDINYYFKKMSLTPAFREKQNRSIKVDKRCEFTVQ